MRVEHITDSVRVYLGDSRDIAPTIEGVGAVVADPPYGMAFRSNHRKEKHQAIANDNDTTLLDWACALKAEHSLYLFARWDNLVHVPKPTSMITWVKNNWSMGDLEHSHARQTEVILFYPGPNHRFPNGRPKDVITAPRTGNDNHPTEKPVQLMRAIIEWTEGLVLDPFMGSGATGMAAIELGRPFVGVEFEPHHFETACRRLADAAKRPSLFTPRKKALKIQPGPMLDL